MPLCIAMLFSTGIDLRLSESRTKASSESGGLGSSPQKVYIGLYSPSLQVVWFLNDQNLAKV